MTAHPDPAAEKDGREKWQASTDLEKDLERQIAEVVKRFLADQTDKNAALKGNLAIALQFNPDKATFDGSGDNNDDMDAMEAADIPIQTTLRRCTRSLPGAVAHHGPGSTECAVSPESTTSSRHHQAAENSASDPLHASAERPLVVATLVIDEPILVKAEPVFSMQNSKQRFRFYWSLFGMLVFITVVIIGIFVVQLRDPDDHLRSNSLLASNGDSSFVPSAAPTSYQMTVTDDELSTERSDGSREDNGGHNDYKTGGSIVAEMINKQSSPCHHQTVVFHQPLPPKANLFENVHHQQTPRPLPDSDGRDGLQHPPVLPAISFDTQEDGDGSYDKNDRV